MWGIQPWKFSSPCYYEINPFSTSLLIRWCFELSGQKQSFYFVKICLFIMAFYRLLKRFLALWVGLHFQWRKATFELLLGAQNRDQIFWQWNINLQIAVHAFPKFCKWYIFCCSQRSSFFLQLSRINATWKWKWEKKVPSTLACGRSINGSQPSSYCSKCYLFFSWLRSMNFSLCSELEKYFP